jgi:hypothetical protein
VSADPELLVETLRDPTKSEIFQRNYDLIEFRKWTNDEATQMTSSSPTVDWPAVKDAFDSMGFQSIVKEGSWQKFVSVFSAL